MKIQPVADKQTGMMKLIVAFRYFSNAPKHELGTSKQNALDMKVVLLIFLAFHRSFFHS
jgi:hypothetical protein